MVEQQSDSAKRCKKRVGTATISTKGITTPPTVLEPNSDAQRAAALSM